MTQFWLQLARRLATDDVIAFDVVTYSDAIMTYIDDIDLQFGTFFRENNLLRSLSA